MKFVGLHAHTDASIGDGLGKPEDHFKFVLENGGEALAITDHGNGNAWGYIWQAKKSLEKKGIPFKPIIGCELYIHPNLEEWARIKSQKDAAAEEENDLVIEVESESKNNKWADPIRRRHHLVVLVQNAEGYKNLCKIITESYRIGFYRFPRVDFRILEKYNKGLIISSACIAGLGSWVIMQNADKGDEAVFKALDAEFKPLLDIFGKERANIEIQFNKLPEQRLVNKYLIEYSKRTGYPLLATADSHYYDPKVWREREMYRLLSQQSKGYNVSAADLPKTIDELKCELYPKNGDQMFDEYCNMYPDSSEELDAIVMEAIERSHQIAFEQIEDFSPDTSMKLPKGFLKGENPDEKLASLCYESLYKMSEEWEVEKIETYKDRLELELNVITKKGFSLYFLTLKEALDKIKEELLIGAGRGSGAGSLVCYLIGITQIDPIEHGLLFERFLSENRSEPPDIDCLHKDTLVITTEGLKSLESLDVGDAVIDINGQPQFVMARQRRNSRKDEIVYEVIVSTNGILGCVVASEYHKFFLKNREIILCKDLKKGDMLSPETEVVAIRASRKDVVFIDIAVTNSSSFRIVPFSVVEVEDQNFEKFVFYVTNYNIDNDVEGLDIENAIRVD